MKNKRTNPGQIWKQLEDRLVPQLRLSTTDRVIYSHLLRHSRLEGKPRPRFSVEWLARGVRLCTGAVRPALRRLIAHGTLLLIKCSKAAGHVVEVRLPDEIGSGSKSRGAASLPDPPRFIDYNEVDFLKTKKLRQAIHSRERGRCFYCLRRLSAASRVLDHVVPRVLLGGNHYRNLVSCCLQCNSQKSDGFAADFLRLLYRDRRLTAAELTARLRALDALAAGKLPPSLRSEGNMGSKTS